MDDIRLYKQCSSCRACVGSAFLTPPVLYTGNFYAPILIIGQNPGDCSKDQKRVEWGKKLLEQGEDVSVTEIMEFYNWDFGTSAQAPKQLGLLFGDEWLTNGMFCFTNAVKCRTHGNITPTVQMITSCKSYTKQMLENRKAVVLMGAVARRQVLGSEAESVPWGTLRAHKHFGFIFAIKHYAAWRGDESDYINTAKRLIELVGKEL